MNSQNPKHALTLRGQPSALVEHLLYAEHWASMWGSSGMPRRGKYRPVVPRIHGQTGNVPMSPPQDQSAGGALLGVASGLTQRFSGVSPISGG